MTLTFNFRAISLIIFQVAFWCWGFCTTVILAILVVSMLSTLFLHLLVLALCLGCLHCSVIWLLLGCRAHLSYRSNFYSSHDIFVVVSLGSCFFCAICNRSNKGFIDFYRSCCYCEIFIVQSDVTGIA